MNLGEEFIRNMAKFEKLTKTEKKTESTDRAKSAESLQECVVQNEKVGILNMGSCDKFSDDTQHTVDMHNVIARTKTGFFSRMRSVAAEAS